MIEELRSKRILKQLPNAKVFTEANQNLINSLTRVKTILPEPNSIIPTGLFNQFEHIAKISALISKQLSAPKTFAIQFEQIKQINDLVYERFRIPSYLIEQMQATAELNRKLISSFEIPTATLEAISHIQRSNYDAILQANKALEQIKKIDLGFLVDLNPLFNIGFNWETILDFSSSIFKFTTEDEFKKFEYNWIGFLSVSEIKKLYKLWKNNEKDKVKDFFYQWFSNETKISNLLKDFNQNKSFKPRMSILRKALTAHLNADYELSIPIFLSQIDGVFISKHNGLAGQITHTCSKCKGKSKAHLNANNISKFILQKQNEYMPFFLEHIIDIFEKLRNDIMHGKKLDYADKDLSTKLILTLVQLNFSK